MDGGLGGFYSWLREAGLKTAATVLGNLFFHLLSPVFVTSRLFGDCYSGINKNKIESEMMKPKGILGFILNPNFRTLWVTISRDCLFCTVHHQ